MWPSSSTLTVEAQLGINSLEGIRMPILLSIWILQTTYLSRLDALSMKILSRSLRSRMVRLVGVTALLVVGIIWTWLGRTFVHGKQTWRMRGNRRGQGRYSTTFFETLLKAWGIRTVLIQDVESYENTYQSTIRQIRQLIVRATPLLIKPFLPVAGVGGDYHH